MTQAEKRGLIRAMSIEHPPAKMRDSGHPRMALWLLVLGAVMLGGWGAWRTFAPQPGNARERIVEQQARIEALEQEVATLSRSDQISRQANAALHTQDVGELEPVAVGQGLRDQQQIDLRRRVCGQEGERLGDRGRDLDLDVGRAARQASPHAGDLGFIRIDEQHAHARPHERLAPQPALARFAQDARQALEVIAMLGQVIVGARTQGGQRGLVVARSGEHHDRQRQAAGAQPAHEFDPAAIGQVQHQATVGVAHQFKQTAHAAAPSTSASRRACA